MTYTLLTNPVEVQDRVEIRLDAERNRTTSPPPKILPSLALPIENRDYNPSHEPSDLRGDDNRGIDDRKVVSELDGANVGEEDHKADERGGGGGGEQQNGGPEGGLLCPGTASVALDVFCAEEEGEGFAFEGGDYDGEDGQADAVEDSHDADALLEFLDLQ